MKTKFVEFMRGHGGRAVRVALGLTLIAVGLAVVGGTAGALIAIFGILPLSSGVFGLCPLGFLFGVDIWGRPRGGCPRGSIRSDGG